MTIELTMLVYSVALLFLLILVQALAGVLAQGLSAMAGSRDHLGEPGVFQARTKRIVDNHREGLLLFAPLVLVADATGVSTEWTVLGAQLFFYSRVVHALLYLTGVPWVRPLAWAAGIAGCVLIFAALFS
ncbi:MAG: MAPEG family protein [Pseudomonadales bacterium]